jgi:hypothetical protein
VVIVFFLITFWEGGTTQIMTIFRGDIAESQASVNQPLVAAPESVLIANITIDV